MIFSEGFKYRRKVHPARIMSTGTANDLGLEKGVNIGATTWLLGFFLTLLIGVLKLDALTTLLVNLGDPVSGALAGYFFYQAWFVTSMPVGGPLGITVFALLPIVLLVAAGFYVASENEGTGPMAGVAIAVGYGGLALLSAITLLVTGGTENIVDLVLMLIVAGVVYPVVFGGIGGAIADQV